MRFIESGVTKMANEKRLDLIDRKALLGTLERYVNPMPGESGTGYLAGLATAMDEVEEAPTVDAVEVVHGNWAYYSTTMQECSNCKRHTARHKFKYCPHCGAVMGDELHYAID